MRVAARKLEEAGQPVLRIETSAADLGAEFFRWEFATAVAGAVLGVNPHAGEGGLLGTEERDRPCES